MLDRRPDLMKNEKGYMLVEVIMSIALMSLIGASVLSGLSTACRSLVAADEHTAARNLAESQLQDIRKQDFAATYTPIPVPSEYAGFATSVATSGLTARDGNLQRITVSVSRDGNEVLVMEGYRVNR